MVPTPPRTSGRPESSPIRVGVNGYGTVGKRVADAVAAQPDMAVRGVSKCTPSADCSTAVARGYPLYSPDEHRPAIEEAYPTLAVAGSVTELLEAADVVVDATPSGVGAQYADRYEESGTPVVHQGGEDRSVADTSFTARVNYEDGRGAESLRVLSCNSTGLARLLDALSERHEVEAVTATLIRRGADPDQPTRGPIDDIVPDPVTVPSHHGPDVQTVLPGIGVTTTALRVPATRMHVQSLAVDVADDPTRNSVVAALEAEPRIRLLEDRYGMNACGAIKTTAADAGRPRGDVWENCVWADSITVRDGRVHCLQAIDQRAIVVPENVDAIRALLGTRDRTDSMQTTNTALDPSVGTVPPLLEESTGANRSPAPREGSAHSRAAAGGGTGGGGNERAPTDDNVSDD